MKKQITTIAAAMVNDFGQILPYTCQATIQQSEEFCKKLFPHYDKLIALGAKIVIVEIKVIE
jgi:cobalamin biosynthesis Co2+ chelatase CbiK